MINTYLEKTVNYFLYFTNNKKKQQFSKKIYDFFLLGLILLRSKIEKSSFAKLTKNMTGM